MVLLAVSAAPAAGADPTAEAAQTTPSGPVDLRSQYRVRIDGQGVNYLLSGDSTGETNATITPIGDMNADGFGDVFVASPDGRGGNGVGYIVLGRAGGGTVDLLDPSRSFRVTGAAGTAEGAGNAVASAGDFNRDGIDDVVIGARYYDAGGNYGRAYVLYGTRTPANVDLGALGTAGIRIDGPGRDSFSQFGNSVASAGDVNHDGFGDVIVGSPGDKPYGRSLAGSAYVLYGRASNTAINLRAGIGANGIEIGGATAVDAAGQSVGDAGDFNGDGLEDLFVGAHQYDRCGTAACKNSGAAYIVYGTASPANVDLLNLGARGLRMDGASAPSNYAYTGYSAAPAGDVNGDGKADVIVGAFGAGNNNRVYSGSAYVVFGRAATGNIDFASFGANGFRIDGASPGAVAGWAVAGVHDVNGDGADDVMVGAPGQDTANGASSGQAAVVFGRTGTSTIDMGSLGGAGFLVDGAAAGDQAGNAVASAGGFTGDGSEGIMLGAPFAANNGRADSGSVYILGGLRPNVGVTKLARPTDATVGDTVEFAVAVTNATSAPGSANGVTLDDTLPAGFTPTAVTTTQGSCTVSGQSVSCAIGRLLPGGGASVLIRGVVTAAGSLTNRATASSTGPSDLDPSDDSGSATVTVRAAPVPPPAGRSELVVEKRADRQVAFVGEALTYTVTVSNRGDADSQPIVLADVFSSLVGVTGLDAADGRCTSRHPIVCRLDPLAPGESTQVRIRVVPLREGELANAVLAVGNVAATPGALLPPAGQAPPPSIVPLAAVRSIDVARVAVRPLRSRAVEPRARLRIQVAPDRRRVRAGQVVRYRLRVQTRRTDAKVLVVCARPAAGLRLVAATDGRIRDGRACWTLARLRLGRSQVFHLRARVERAFPGGNLVLRARARALNAARAAAAARISVANNQRPCPSASRTARDEPPAHAAC